MTLPLSAVHVNTKTHWLVVRLHDRRIRSNSQGVTLAKWSVLIEWIKILFLLFGSSRNEGLS